MYKDIHGSIYHYNRKKNKSPKCIEQKQLKKKRPWYIHNYATTKN